MCAIDPASLSLGDLFFYSWHLEHTPRRHGGNSRKWCWNRMWLSYGLRLGSDTRSFSRLTTCSHAPVTVTLFGKAILRVLIGMAFVLIARDIMKKITIPLACKPSNVPCGDIQKQDSTWRLGSPTRVSPTEWRASPLHFFVPCTFLFLGISWWGTIIYDKKGGCQLLISKNTL
jgi:hypothetical protein